MKMMLKLLTFHLLLFSLIACNNQKEVANQEEVEIEEMTATENYAEGPAAEKQSSEFPSIAIARIQRTACFGRCPIYILTIYEDGTVIYEGQKWVEKEGTYLAKVGTAKIDLLFKKAKAIDFFKLEDEYDSESVTDLPSVITTLKKDDVVKQVVNRYQGPDQLREFENYFDELFKELNWSKMDEQN